MKQDLSNNSSPASLTFARFSYLAGLPGFKRIQGRRSWFGDASQVRIQIRVTLRLTKMDVEKRLFVEENALTSLGSDPHPASAGHDQVHFGWWAFFGRSTPLCCIHQAEGEPQTSGCSSQFTGRSWGPPTPTHARATQRATQNTHVRGGARGRPTF